MNQSWRWFFHCVDFERREYDLNQNDAEWKILKEFSARADDGDMEYQSHMHWLLDGAEDDPILPCPHDSGDFYTSYDGDGKPVIQKYHTPRGGSDDRDRLPGKSRVGEVRAKMRKLGMAGEAGDV